MHGEDVIERSLDFSAQNSTACSLHSSQKYGLSDANWSSTVAGAMSIGMRMPMHDFHNLGGGGRQNLGEDGSMLPFLF